MITNWIDRILWGGKHRKTYAKRYFLGDHRH
jgi:hypothetical protein